MCISESRRRRYLGWDGVGSPGKWSDSYNVMHGQRQDTKCGGHENNGT